VSSLPGLDDGDVAKYHVTAAAVTVRVLMLQRGRENCFVRQDSRYAIKANDCMSSLRAKYSIS
jgi:hypothetical protein